MSEEFDLRCLTCGKCAGMSWNHGGAELTDLLRHRDTIAEAVTALSGSESSISVTHWRGDVPAQFFADHRGHEIVAWSEFGRSFGICWKPIACGECKHEGRCVLPSKHEGECSRERTTKEGQ